MLTEYQPSVEVTGGPWYTDQELDQDFVETILQHCLRYIQSRSFPKSVNSNAIDKTLYSSSYVGYPSAIDVKNYITRSSIANVELGLENINTLLKVLEFDGKIERLASDLTKRDVKMAIDSDSDSGDDEESWVFKALPTSFTTAPSTTTTSTSTITAFAWTDTPCGHCPMFDFCSEEGPISPNSCEYYKRWLK